jgi:hypothetical protein
VQFTFVVEPNNVLEPVAVTMRLISSFAQFPSAQPAQAAVMFEPDGFVFSGAGVLIVTYPTPPTPAQVATYSFAADGSNFHLVPSMVNDTNVQTVVHHFSGTGAGLWQPDEIARVDQQSIKSAYMQMEQDLYGQIRRGEPTAGTYQKYFDEHIKPYLESAKKDCALARVLIPQILGLTRENELLGTNSETRANILAAVDFTSWTCNCLDEAMQSCRKGKITSQTLLQAWLEMERHAAILGLEDVGTMCGAGSLTDVLVSGVGQFCKAGWTGTASYNAGGTTTTTGSNTTHTGTFAQSFSGQLDSCTLVESTNAPAGDGTLLAQETWEAIFSGTSNASLSLSTVAKTEGQCGTVVQTAQSSGAGNAAIQLRMRLTFEGDRLKTLNLNPVSGKGSVTFDMPGTNQMRIPKCDGSGDTDVTTTDSKTESLSPLSPSAFKAIVFTQQSPQVVEGNLTEVREGGPDNISTKLSWKFSLRR